MAVDISGREMGMVRPSNCEGVTLVRSIFSRKESAVGISMGSAAYKVEQ